MEDKRNLIYIHNYSEGEKIRGKNKGDELYFPIETKRERRSKRGSAEIVTWRHGGPKIWGGAKR